MSLNRYHNSRASDSVFKLLHEEDSYLDILKGNVKSVYKDEIEETDGTHDTVRQTLLQEKVLQEEGGVGDITGGEKEEGTPEEQEKAVKDEAVPKGAETDNEMGVKEESIDQMIEKELEEISIAVVRGAGKRAGQQAAAVRKGFLRGKGSLKKYGGKSKKAAFTPGLRG